MLDVDGHGDRKSGEAGVESASSNATPFASGRMLVNRCRILAQRASLDARRGWHRLRHALSPGQALAVVVLGLAGVAAFGITPDTVLDAVVTTSVVRPLPLPVL